MNGTVAIIGGGIGGLAAARALHDDGWQVTLFEREHDLAGAGTALGIWPSALRALDRIGVGATVRAQGTAQDAAQILRRDGRLIATLDVAGLRRRTGDPVYLLSRPALLELLRAAAPAASLHFGQPADDLASLRSRFDLVVGADGVFSRTRRQLFGPGFEARSVGITAWRGWIDHRPTNAFTEVWGSDGLRFGVTPQEHGRTNWYATARSADGDLRSRFAGWPSLVTDVLATIEDESVLQHELFVVPKLPTYVRSTVALIGDAAHAMTPDLGRGACEALVDAVALADELRIAPDLATGLAGYDRARRRVTQRTAAAALAANRLTRWRRALWLRDLLVRLSLLAPMPA
jgi:2-polyprenyl-6-methoxyphenol hydroxylase-like FAD-dependent oxidoreductase